MNITELETLAAEKNASFKMRPMVSPLVVKAKPDVVKEILAVIDRDEVLAVLRARDGFTDEIEHIVAPKVKSLARTLGGVSTMVCRTVDVLPTNRRAIGKNVVGARRATASISTTH